MNIVENPIPSGFSISQDNRGHTIIAYHSSGVGCQIAFFVLWLSLFALLFLALTIQGEIDPIGFVAHGSWKEWLAVLFGLAPCWLDTTEWSLSQQTSDLSERVGLLASSWLANGDSKRQVSWLSGTKRLQSQNELSYRRLEACQGHGLILRIGES